MTTALKSNNLKKGLKRKAARQMQRTVADDRAARIVELHVAERMPMKDIAAREGVSIGRVSQIITEAKKGWAERRNEVLQAQQDEAMAMLDHLQGLAKRAYLLSCQPTKESAREQERRLEEIEDIEDKIARAQTKINGKKNGSPGVPRMMVVPRALRVVGEKDRDSTKWREEGNPKFLDIFKWCVEVRLKMCGLLTTTELNVDNRQGVFAELLQQLVVPPPIPDDQRVDPVQMRLEALATSEKNDGDGNGQEAAGQS